MAAAPRPKNVPALSSILKTPKRKEVAPDDEDPISKTPKHPISKTPKRNEVAPDDEDEEIEADENGTFGDTSRRWNAGISLPCLLFYVFCKLFITLEYS